MSGKLADSLTDITPFAKGFIARTIRINSGAHNVHDTTRRPGCESPHTEKEAALPLALVCLRYRPRRAAVGFDVVCVPTQVAFEAVFDMRRRFKTVVLAGIHH